MPTGNPRGTIDTRLAALEALATYIEPMYDDLNDLESGVQYLQESKRTLEKVSAAGPITRGVTCVTTANADKVMTLPAAAGIDTTYDFVIMKVDSAGSGKIVLTPGAGDTIGGAATLTSPASALASVHVVADGEHNWTVLGTSGTWT